jgi:hypothetical protein
MEGWRDWKRGESGREEIAEKGRDGREYTG